MVNKAQFKKGYTPWNAGKKATDEHRKKISESLKGNKRSLGYRHSEKTRMQMSESKKGYLSYRWKGGKSEYLKEGTKKRDNYTCQSCGLRETEPGFMDVNHIIPISVDPSLRFNINNLETLCPNCHRRKTIPIYRRKWDYHCNERRIRSSRPSDTPKTQ